MKRTKKAVQKLVPFRLAIAVAARSRTNPELPDYIIILCCCSICRKPITDFDRADLFTLLTKETRGPNLRRFGTIGENRHPLLLDCQTLYVGHVECCNGNKAIGGLTMFFRKKLSSVLKADQRDERDRVLERLVF